MKSIITKGRFSWLAGMVALSATIGGCDFLDPTNVENPRTTADDLANATEPTAASASWPACAVRARSGSDRSDLGRDQ